MTLTEEPMAKMGCGNSLGSNLELPPKVFVGMKGKFVEYQEERTRSQLFMMAEVFNAVGKLVAVSYATCSVLGQ